MSLEQEVEILRKIPLFAKIEPAKLKLLAFTSESLTFKAGKSLVKQGDTGDSAFIIIEGSADVVVNTPGGPITVASMGRNDIVGDIAILIDIPRTATVTATSELVALKVTKERFFQMVVDSPEIGVEIMRELAQRLVKTTAQLTEARAAAKQ